MTTQILSAMGAPLGKPEDMIGADEWNKSGYFESKEAVELNLQLMLGVGIDTNIWMDPPVRPVKRLASFVTSPKWRYFLPCSDKDITQRAEKISKPLQSFSQRNAGVFVKDPRFAVTHKAWTEHGHVEGIILSFRNPNSVARSIQKRDLIPRFISLKTWYKYNAEFLRNLKSDTPLLLVDYDQFFDENSHGYITQLAQSLANVTGQKRVTKFAKEAINISERHHLGSTAHLPKKIQNAYNALKECSAAGPVWTDAEHLCNRLDEVI